VGFGVGNITVGTADGKIVKGDGARVLVGFNVGSKTPEMVEGAWVGTSISATKKSGLLREYVTILALKVPKKTFLVVFQSQYKS